VPPEDGILQSPSARRRTLPRPPRGPVYPALRGGGRKPNLFRGGQSGPQAGIPPLLPVVADHLDHLFLIPYQDEEFFGTGDGGIEHASGKEQGGAVAHRQHHCPVLAALGLMYGHGVGGLQLPQHIGGVLHHPPVEVHSDPIPPGVDLRDAAPIPAPSPPDSFHMRS